jgi:L-ascorbate metabolism protein UlaG (beta-lactamase superfamily)
VNDLRAFELRWLGQTGFMIRAGATTLLVDPYLSPHPDRLVAPPFAPESATGTDAVLCTHEHWDHLDPETLPALAQASPEARIVVPAPIVEQVTRLGIDAARVVGARVGEPIAIGDVTVHPVSACHGVERADAYSFGRELSDGLDRYLGFVFECRGTRVYHAGDTIPYDGLAETLRALRAQLGLLPINGRDPEREGRGIVGNMSADEAAALAVAAGLDTVVPTHWDMFAANPGDPARLVQLLAGDSRITVLVPARARPFLYTPAA